MTDRRSSAAKNLGPILSVCAVLAILNALTVTTIVRSSRNLLVENGHWVGTKVLLEGGAMGGAYFLATRQALHRNRLDLGAWHGSQEVSLNRGFEPGRIGLSFRLEPGANLSVLFNRDAGGTAGVRLARGEGAASAFFRAGPDGAFLHSSALDAPEPDGAWHRLEVFLSPEEARIVLDGRDAGRFPLRRKAEQIVSLRAGRARALVDDVEILDAANRLVHADSFGPRGGFAGLFLAALVAVVAVPAAAAGLRASLGRLESARSALLGAIAFLFSLWVVLGALFAFDFLFWSARYPYDRYTPWNAGSSNLLARVENLRCALFRTSLERDDVLARIHAAGPLPFVRDALTGWDGRQEPHRHFRVHGPRYPEGWRTFTNGEIHRIHDKTPDTTRLAFVGTSQTVGEGADVLEHSFAGLVHEELAASMTDGRLLETFVFALKGQTSGGLFERWQRVWIETAPDVVLVNLGHNDDHPAALRRNLEAFAALNEARGIRTVFVLEPNSTERPYTRLRRKHDAIREAGRQSGVPVWDLHGHLSEPEIAASGFLWWDDVHLTTYGHRVAARFLVERLRGLAAPRVA